MVSRELGATIAHSRGLCVAGDVLAHVGLIYEASGSSTQRPTPSYEGAFIAKAQRIISIISSSSGQRRGETQ